MMTLPAPRTPEAAEGVPVAAWAVGWSSLGGQLIFLAEAGAQDESAWPLPVLFGVLLVGLLAGVIGADSAEVQGRLEV